MKKDKIELSGGGYKAIVQSNSSPAFTVCIFLFIVGLWSAYTGEKVLFIICASVVLITFIGFLFFSPQRLMDSRTLFEWTKTFIGDKDHPQSIEEGDIVKTEVKTIPARAKTVRRK